MTARQHRSGLAAAGILALALTASACGTGGGTGGTAAKGNANPNASKPECTPFKAFQGHSGTHVSIYTSILDTEADNYVASFKPFEDCTGIKIDYQGSSDFEAQLNVKVAGGNAPDIAFLPQPGLLQRFAKSGKLKVAPKADEANVDANWSPSWKGYGSVDGKFYGAPMSANVKSFVWYSPKEFKAKGYTIPTTYADMLTLSDKIVASGHKPWCAGIASGAATGWTATDWLEDIMLRTAGPDVYDQWVNHKIPFNDPQVVKALDMVGGILKNNKYVNGGFGDYKSITTTTFQNGGLPILKGTCSLHRQASFYSNQWPKGTKVAVDGDVFAFYFPVIDPSKGKPVDGGGEFVGAFADRPEVQAVQTFLSTDTYANTRVKPGGWLSANKKLDVSLLLTPIDKTSVQILQDPKAIFRFDASDQMPAAVGSGSEWKGLTAWLNGKDTKPVLDDIEKSWPKS